jgi:predicted transcriptional regulator
MQAADCILQSDKIRRIVMTIKEIADLCGVDERTVLRWAHRLEKIDPNNLTQSAEKISAARFLQIVKDIKEKLENAGHGIPADFTLEETITIIGKGGENETLASLLSENARKNTLEAQITQNAQTMVEMMAIL